MVNHKLIIGHLYPKQMNVYGDMGNITVLRYRLEQRGFHVEYVPINSLNQLKNVQIDILIGGGGQDSNQERIQIDLQKYRRELKMRCTDGLVALMVCGMYQLFGHRFVLDKTSEIPGLGILDLETKATGSRLIGNLVVKSKYGKLVGFENHSGRTYLGSGVTPLGKVLKGAGNNGETGEEGAIYKNVFGTYMHGPVLTKNPQLADELLRRALKQRGNCEALQPLDDFIEYQAAALAMRRPR